MFPQKHKNILGPLYARIHYLLVLGIFCFSFGLLAINSNSSQVQAATSSTLNFQGRLLTSSGSLVPDGLYNLQFKIYDGGTDGGPAGTGEANAGTNLWTESWYDSNGGTAGNDNRVRIVNGYFSVTLGAQTAFPGTINWDQELWLTMNVGGTAQTATPTYDGEMLAPSSKRTKLTAVPYSFVSGRALSVASNNTNAASTNSTNVTIQSGNAAGATSNSGNISIDVGTATQTAGTIGIGTSNQTGLTIGRSGISTALQGNVSIAGGTNFGVYYRDGSGNVVTTAAGTSGQCFLATTGAAPVWGTCSGSGDIIQGGNDFNTDMTIGTNDADNFNFETNGSTRMTLQSDGDLAVDTDTLFVDAANNRVGIGTSSPAAQLQVSGAGGGNPLLIITDTTATARDVLTIADGGATTFRNQTDSANGFQILDQGGASLFNINTSTSAISIGEIGTSTTTISSANTTIGNAAGSGQLTNNGSTLNTSLALGDLAAGSIGTAATTVDVYTSFTISPTASGRTYTIPSPTSASAGRLIYISNINGSNTFTIAGNVFSPGSTATLIWNGSAWTFSGVDGGSGNYIQNQNSTDQTGNFRISGTGQANTSFIAPLFDSISGALSIGTSTATGVTLGGTTNTTSVLLQGAAAATYTIGTSNNTGGITVGNSTASNTISIGSAAGNGNTQTINIGTSATAGSTTNVTIGSTIAGVTTIQSQGGVAVTTLGAVTANSAALCRDTSTNLLTTCDANTTGKPFLQSGNSFGATAVLGTNDNNGLQFKINNTGVARFTTNTNSIYFGNSTNDNGQAASPNAFNIAGTGSATAGTAGAALTVRGGAGATTTTGSAGGALNLQGGTAGGTNANAGGTIAITGGTPSATGVGGAVSITSGAGGSTSGNSGAVTIASGDTTSGTAGNISIDVGTSTASNGSILVGTAARAQTISIGNTTGATGITLQSGTGNINFGAAGGSGLFVNNGATRNTALALGNFATGGSIGSAATTVDIYTYITINQTTASQTLTIQDPTSATAGRFVYITNIGSTNFTLSQVSGSSYTVLTGSSLSLIWNGSDWTSAGDGAGGVSAIGTIDGGTYSANGASIAGTVIYLQTASNSQVGLVNTTGQDFAGLKTFNGGITVGASAGSGTTFTNNGSTFNATLALADDNNGGVLGSTAAATVDIYTSVSIAQTTASQTFTIASPTNSTNYGRLLYVSNIGTASFTLINITLNPGSSATLVWSNTNGGASWQFAGADGSSILNQNTSDQSANFRISGTGRANTSFISPLFDSISGGLSLGTSTATGVTIGGTTNTTSVLLQGAAAATYTIGTSNNTGGITVGNSTASNTINIGNANTATGNTQTINIGAGTPAGTGLTAITIGNLTNTSSLLLRGGTGDVIARTADLFDIQNSASTSLFTVNSSASATNVALLAGALTANAAQNGFGLSTTFTPTTDATRNYYGANINPVFTGNAANFDNITFAALNALAQYNATGGRLQNAVGINAGVSNTNNRTLANAYGIQVQNAVNSGGGVVTSAAGIAIADQTVGTNRTNLLIGTTTIPASTWSIYNSSASNNLFAGNLVIGGTAAPTANLSFAEGSTRTINVITRTTSAAGSGLTISAGAGGTGATNAGGVLTLQGGAGGATGNANGGGVTISGGAGVGTGVQGLVNLSTSAFTSASTQTFAASGSLTAGLVDQFSTIPVNATAASLTVTVPAPNASNQVVGRLLYLSAVDNSNDFTISLAGTAITIVMKENSTATLIWNGTGWTAAGASSSTDLQSAYNNTIASAGGAELVLNAPGGAADGLTIRNNGTTPIVGGLLEVQTSIGSNLFTVNNNAAEFANNGGSESATYTMWTGAFAGGAVTRNTTIANVATGQASVQVVTTGTGHGAENTLSSALTANLKYAVSYTVKGATNFATLETVYSRDGTNTSTTSCNSAQTVTTAQFTRINCSFTAPSTGITASNSIFIRQTDATGRTFYVDNLSVTVSADVNHAADGSVDLALGSNWTDFGANGGGTTAAIRNTTVLYDTSGSVEKTTGATADRGIINNLTISPSINTQYLVTFYARSSNTFNDIRVRYSRDGGTSFATCNDYNTQSVSTTTYTKITCIFTTDGTTPTNADLVIDQPTATARTFYVDALTVTLNTNNSNNVQIGGGAKGGPTTLFTLDRSAGAPIAANNDAYLGSMYYDTTTGRIQCYEADGWGACGAAPDNIVNLNPEYAGAVLNGTGVGTMTADFCAEQAGVLNVNTALCASGEAKNYYRWTSPQATQQTYSIFVTYQLPATFNGFSSDDTVQLVGRVDNTTNASVTYEMFKSTGSAVTQCGTGETNVITGGGGAADTWYSYGINGNESTGCSFNSSSAGNFIIFKINLKANSNANAYVSTLSFTTTGR